MKSNLKIDQTFTQMYVSRAERYELTGVAVPTQIDMERRGIGPEPLRPLGFGKVMYRWSDVQKWMEGESLPSWAPDQKKNKRGENLRRSDHPRPGRPRKKPKIIKTETDDDASAEGGAS